MSNLINHKKMKQKIYLAGIFLLLSATAYSVPARLGWQTRQQADGTSVEVQLMGDEYYHYWVTRDGNLAVEEPAGMRVTARRAPAYPQRAPQGMGEKNLAPRGLVILAGFKDLPFQAENDSVSMWKMLNESGYNYNGATGSARDYFIAQSDSQYMPEFDVAGPIVLPQNRAYYGGNSTIGRDNLASVKQMVKDACTMVDPYIDFTKYVNQSNPNKIDFVYILFAGIGENDYDGEDDAVWPKRSTISLTLDGKTLEDFACSGEIDGGTHQRNGIGTFCHEFGHVIGFPDYYDTSTGYNNDNCLTPGGWSVMDQGSYNNDCKTPPNYSLFDKYFMGWLTPKVLSKDAKLYVTMGTEYEDGYMVTRDGTLAPFTSTDTVYYIENRQKKGWDLGLYGHGMLAWQVVYEASSWTNSPNNVKGKPRLTVVSAKPGEPIGYSNANPFPGSENVTNCTLRPGYVMTTIVEADGKISFKLNSDTITLTLDVNNTEAGSVQGAGRYEWFTDVGFSAISNYGYHFTQWNDGNTDNTRTIKLTQDTTFTAEFAKNTYQVQTSATHGSVEGASTCLYMEQVNLKPVPETGYVFAQWSDGNKENPRIATITKDTLFTAEFMLRPCAITLISSDENKGSVFVEQDSYPYGSTVTVTANPVLGYKFEQWSNGVQDNPYTFTIVSDTTLMATFVADSSSSIDNIGWGLDPDNAQTQKFLRNGQLFILRWNRIYTLTGQEVR